MRLTEHARAALQSVHAAAGCEARSGVQVHRGSAGACLLHLCRPFVRSPFLSIRRRSDFVDSCVRLFGRMNRTRSPPLRSLPTDTRAAARHSRPLALPHTVPQPSAHYTCNDACCPAAPNVRLCRAGRCATRPARACVPRTLPRTRRRTHARTGMHTLAHARTPACKHWSVRDGGNCNVRVTLPLALHCKRFACWSDVWWAAPVIHMVCCTSDTALSCIANGCLRRHCCLVLAARPCCAFCSGG